MVELKLKLSRRFIARTRTIARAQIVALALLAALSLMICAAGCSQPEKDKAEPVQSSSASVEEKDPEYPVSAFGATLDSRPGKVVSLSPALTEKVIELGLSDRLEGISKGDDEVSGRELPRVGTAQLVNMDAVAAISPHLLLTEAELTQETLDALGELGVAVATVPHASTVDELKGNYLGIAKLLEGDRSGGEMGGAFCGRIDQRLDELAAKKPGETKNAVYIRFLDYTVATGDKLESKLMEVIGLRNIAEGYTGWTYPEKEAKAAEGLENFKSIDFIFCDKRGVTMKMMEKSEFWKVLNAVRKDYYLYIDNTAFERQSLRMFDELYRMQQYILGEIPSSKDEENAAG